MFAGYTEDVTRVSILMIVVALLAGCAPRQDPGVPLPPPGSGDDAIRREDAKSAGGIVAPSADQVPTK